MKETIHYEKTYNSEGEYYRFLEKIEEKYIREQKFGHTHSYENSYWRFDGNFLTKLQMGLSIIIPHSRSIAKAIIEKSGPDLKKKSGIEEIFSEEGFTRKRKK